MKQLILLIVFCLPTMMSVCAQDLTEKWWLTLHTFWADRDYDVKIDELIKNGADINLQTTHDMFMQSPDSIKGNGQTVLMFMAGRQMLYRIENLVRLRADVDIKDSDGRTALHHLALSGYVYDEDVERSNNSGEYYYYNGFNANHEKNLEYKFERIYKSLKSELNVSVKDNYGKTAFDYAFKNQPLLAKIIYFYSSDEDKLDMERSYSELFTKAENEKIHSFISKYGIVRNEKDKLTNRIYNELWWWEREIDPYAHTAAAESFFFSENGMFNYEKYYSGGMYDYFMASGTYKYDEKTGIIELKAEYIHDDYPGITLPSQLSISNIRDSSIVLGKQRFDRIKNTNRFVLYEDGDKMRIDKMKLSAYINDKPFCSVYIKPEDYESFVDIINLTDNWQKAVLRKDVENAIKISVTIIQNSYENRYFIIWPELNLIERGSSMYNLKSNVSKMEKCKRVLSSYFQIGKL